MASEKDFKIASFYLATILVMIVVVILTIASELNPPLKAGLAATFGHHWVGKGVISVIIYLVIGLGTYPMLSKQSILSVKIWTIALTAVLIIGALAIYGFFWIEYSIAHGV